MWCDQGYNWHEIGCTGNAQLCMHICTCMYVCMYVCGDTVCKLNTLSNAHETHAGGKWGWRNSDVHRPKQDWPNRWGMHDSVSEQRGKINYRECHTYLCVVSKRLYVWPYLACMYNVVYKVMLRPSTTIACYMYSVVIDHTYFSI